MNGSIGVHSRLGEGSRFSLRVSLPVAPVDAADGDPDSAVSARRGDHVRYRIPGQARILIAEDNVFNQKVASLTVAKLGVHADLANNGREALRMVQDFRYDLVLMDCQMPGDGRLRGHALHSRARWGFRGYDHHRPDGQRHVGRSG